MTKTKEETTTAEPKIRTDCVYRVFTSLAIRNSGQWINASRAHPVIADLSDCSDESIRILLDKGYIETADGTPINKATGAVERSPCPCSKKE